MKDFWSKRDDRTEFTDPTAFENPTDNVEQPTTKEESTKSWTPKRIFWLLVKLFLVAGTIVSLSVVLTGNPNPVEYFVPVDPPGYSEAIKWDQTSHGLKLVVENACDDSWTPLFDESIGDWNVTDALHLQTVRDAYDYDCHPNWGRLRVCNGDYGNTDWKGLNVAFMRGELVQHSVSKMNDYHLAGDDHQRLYTMCHELGHGFGLPHTDENHFNMNRFDCMDYTNRPRSNRRPGRFNLNLLAEMYGSTSRPRTPPPSPVTTMPPRPVNDKKDKEKEKEKDKDDRLLRGSSTPERDDPFASGRQVLDTVFDTYAAYMKQAEACDQHHCSIDLGQGYHIEVSMLFVH